MTTPIPKSIEMAGDRDLYSVSFDWDLTRDLSLIHISEPTRPY